MNHYATFKDLEDASVFITGGGSGIGASIVEGFLSQGAKVAFVQRSNCDEFLDQISSKYKHKPLFIRCDITDTNDLKDAISEDCILKRLYCYKVVFLGGCIIRGVSSQNSIFLTYNIPRIL